MAPDDCARVSLAVWPQRSPILAPPAPSSARPEAVTVIREIVMNIRNDHGAFADRRRHTLHRLGPHVPDGKDPGTLVA